MKQTFVLSGKVPPKKNNRRLFFSKGRPISMPSESYEAWHREKALILKSRGFKPYFEPVSIHLDIYAPNQRVFDGDNVMTSVLDLFKDLGIITDDNVHVVTQGSWHFRGVDKERPRVEVTIEPEKHP